MDLEGEASVPTVIIAEACAEISSSHILSFRGLSSPSSILSTQERTIPLTSRPNEAVATPHQARG